jgi:hypothetical protein
MDPTHLLPEHPCAQANVFQGNVPFQTRRVYTTSDIREYDDFLHTQLEHRRYKIHTNIQRTFDVLHDNMHKRNRQPISEPINIPLQSDEEFSSQFKNWRGIKQWDMNTGEAVLRMVPTKLYDQLDTLSPQQTLTAKCVLNAWEKYVYDPYRNDVLRQLPAYVHASLAIVMGVAGSGESRLIGALTTYFQYTAMQKYVEDHTHSTAPIGRFFCVTATTGLAACNIEGQTIYRVAGFNSRGTSETKARTTIYTTKLKVDGTVEMISINGYAALVLDEVSFLNVVTFSGLDDHLRILTQIDAPFGGYFVIFLGDFKQLPPPMSVRNTLYDCYNPRPLSQCNTDAQRRNHPKAAQGIKLWMSIQNVVILTESFRHKFDPTYMDLVTKLRSNEASETEQQLIRTLMLSDSEIASHPKFSTALQAFPTNTLVWKHNVNAMAQHQSHTPIANI